MDRERSTPLCSAAELTARSYALFCVGPIWTCSVRSFSAFDRLLLPLPRSPCRTGTMTRAGPNSTGTNVAAAVAGGGLCLRRILLDTEAAHAWASDLDTTKVCCLFACKHHCVSRH